MLTSKFVMHIDSFAHFLGPSCWRKLMSQDLTAVQGLRACHQWAYEAIERGGSDSICYSLSLHQGISNSLKTTRDLHGCVSQTQWQYKTVVPPRLYHWRYCNLLLSHINIIKLCLSSVMCLNPIDVVAMQHPLLWHQISIRLSQITKN